MIQKTIETLEQDFSKISSWEEKYKKIIKLGKELPKINDDEKLDKYLVKGCQSQVWLLPEFREGKVYYRGESDAMIVQGLLALVLSVYSGNLPQEILKTPADFLERLGLKKHLSPNRANGLFSLVKQILYYAQAFDLLHKSSATK